MIKELKIETAQVKWINNIGTFGRTEIEITKDNRIVFGFFKSAPYKTFELAKIAANKILIAN